MHKSDHSAGSRILIDAPPYSCNSNGIKCVYFLAESLSKKGYLVGLVPRKSKGFRNLLPESLARLPIVSIEKSTQNDVFICTESVPKHSVLKARRSGSRLIWWYLAPHGLLEKSKLAPLACESICCFSSYIYPDSKEYFFCQPTLDEAWRDSLKISLNNRSNEQMVIGIYTGKGRLHQLPKELHQFILDAKLIAFTRNTPKSRSKMFQQLNYCDGIISLDELSQFNLEAATLGIPIFTPTNIFHKKSHDRFPLSIANYLKSSPHEFFELVHQRRQAILRPLGLQAINQLNRETINAFEAKIQNAAHTEESTNAKAIKNLIDYGKRLHSKRALMPLIKGQAPSASLIYAYIHSLKHSFFEHQSICMLAKALDHAGSILNAFHALQVFVKIYDLHLPQRLATKALCIAYKLAPPPIKSSYKKIKVAYQTKSHSD